MTVLPIIQPDNPLLRRPALRITDFGVELQRLIDNMLDTMLDAKGLGLAAPQVAHSLRLILARLPDDEESRAKYADDAGRLYILANPKIIRRSAETVTGTEGCLSLPGLLGDVERHENIELAGQDRLGNPIRLSAAGWLARVFQHEIDHLDGILYIDIATSVWRPADKEEGAVADKSGAP
ncbi:MAG: peptide deformylase [Chloroflexi bacterium]|nr:peptide deformylase [Chloroflexota bacterium]